MLDNWLQLVFMARNHNIDFGYKPSLFGN